ncbi:DUF4350 domain-containing protein [uncultured Bacteroides sp.]|uniref:DUF4350 domain-containing protein n=1 Tax=uncultured Bacteroides sp. TaxID=162156 RepID=UPI002AAB63EB|nr:DUF4350 domain-containing protein [uncultured Bacteroides sp.]
MVKVNFKFIGFMILLIIGMFVVEQNQTKEFSWKATYNKADKQPFGCFVFDDIVSSSMKGNYSVSNKTFYQMDNDSLSKPKAILSVTDYAFVDSLQFKSVINLLNKGYKIMFVSSNFSPDLIDSLRIDCHNSYLSDDDIKSMTKKSPGRKPLFVFNSATSRRIYRFYPQLCTDYFSGVDSIEPKLDDTRDDKRKHTLISRIPSTVLVRNKENFAVAFSKKIGKGELFMVTTPLLFTNYGILDENNAGYVFNLLSYMKGMPLVRYQENSSGGDHAGQESPLRYFLSQPPLRWSVYFTLFTLILFMCFTAKRRQRVIPVINPPVNTTLDFVKLIGTLYYQKKDHLGLLRKKKIYFARALKKETNIDIEAEKLTMELCHRLSSKTGMEAEKIYSTLRDLEMLEYDIPIDEKDLKDYIDRMNEIITNSYK